MTLKYIYICKVTSNTEAKELFSRYKNTMKHIKKQRKSIEVEINSIIYKHVIREPSFLGGGGVTCLYN